MGKTGRAFTETVAPYAASPDPDDAILLAQALAAGCSHFVTNDGKLLALDRIGEMLLVTPRAFAEIIGMV